MTRPASIHPHHCRCHRCAPGGPADRTNPLRVTIGVAGFLLLFVALPSLLNLIVDRLAG